MINELTHSASKDRMATNVISFRRQTSSQKVQKPAHSYSAIIGLITKNSMKNVSAIDLVNTEDTDDSLDYAP